jgi:hypothetical protein
MYCKDCKYWKRFSKGNSNYDETNEKRGKCSSLKFVDTSSLDGLEEGEPLVDYDGNRYEVGANDTLEYSDYEIYQARFNTGENFGCIHFEKR